MKKKVIIEIEKGVVTEVISNVQLDDVVVVDKDNQDNGQGFIDYPTVVNYEHDNLHLYYASDCTRDQEIMDELKYHKI